MNQPLTWLDIERTFKHFTLDNVRVHCFPDGAEIEYSVDVANVHNWLKKIFGIYLSDDFSSITLQIDSTTYPLEFNPSDSLNEKPTQYPLWRDAAYFDNKTLKLSEPWTETPNMVSFHSFKGGVGRTTSLMTYVSAVLDTAKDPIKLLLIDADLEAPGISFWLEGTNKPNVSFIQLLEALHYPPVNVDSTLEFFAAQLRKTSLNFGGVDKEVFVLPAALNMAEIMDMPVQPEHLARNPHNPWILSEHLRALGQKLQVDVIFIDLRAGLSELASPLLFDSRVEHFFVTTVALQSILGMQKVLERLYLYQKPLSIDRFSLAKPSVILSLLTPQIKQLPDYSNAIELLDEAYPNCGEEEFSEGIDWSEVDFEPSFMSLRTVREAIEILKKSSLFPKAAQWASARFQHVDNKLLASINIISDAKCLYDVCNKFQFAEVTASSDMLITDPLRNLAKHYVFDAPNAVSVGAKGAGKTFTFLQICQMQTWQRFLEKMEAARPTGSESLIYPALYSTNLGGHSLKVVQDARQNCKEKLLPQLSSSNRFQMRIPDALKLPETNWENFWIEVLFDDMGITCTSISELNTWLHERNTSLVILIDGIEDAFDNPEDDTQKAAIKALLQLPNKLAELRQRQIGFICFVRADYVQSVIRQNVAQYLARFSPFQLEWTPETFLRLAYWICAHAGIIDAKKEMAEKLSIAELLIELEKLWGKKMGRDNSKESNTARWVFAALCDLNGKLQARDLVRFLKFSAAQMNKISPDKWPSRVLAPEAIRRSLSFCSDEKVKEAASEISALRQWQQKLDSVPSDKRRNPFNAKSVNLEGDLLEILRDLGIVYEDTDRSSELERFYLPEIYRSGLKFSQSAGGRPRVQALLKRNLGGVPF